MRLPLSWLNEFVKIDDIPVGTLKDKLFSCGFEVEEIIKINENVKNIVVCQINAIEQHPNADKLSVCAVNAGEHGQLQIVTNAKNIKVGDKVPVSLDGAVLADGTQIKKGKLRGVESDGMFCGGAEIGITEEYYDGAGEDSVLVFHDDFPVGADVCELLGAIETVFDIGVTANRPDCQSILGLAREVAAILERPLIQPDYSFTAESADEVAPVTVDVKAPDLCPRYIAGYVKDVVIKPSPKAMQKRLALMGIRAINSVVDVTNYVLCELGQPMHAFDYSKIGGKQIIIRRAENGEKITTLDDKEFTLKNDNLVICDAEKPVALAGIMGGKDSGIEDYTSSVVFECAVFKRDNIRRSSKALGQRSDSSARFEKGVDEWTTARAMNRALHLIESMGAGKACYKIIDVRAENDEKQPVIASYNGINAILGITVEAEKQKKILENLGFTVKETANGKIEVTPPPYRDDVEGEADLAEEVIRTYGYDHIQPRLFEQSSVTFGGRTSAQEKEEKLKDLLAANGFCEIMTYSFVSEKDYETFGLDKNAPENAHIKLFNPLGEDMSVMRTTLIPSMVATVCRNLNKKNYDGDLFELAKVYLPEAGSELPRENARLCLASFGKRGDFFDLKGMIQTVFEVLRVNGEVCYSRSKASYMHPGRSADITVDGKYLGVLGELHPALVEKLGASGKICVAELDFDLILQLAKGKINFSAISKFPAVERDLALVCPLETTNAEIEKLIYERGGKNLVSVRIFDVYTGKGVDEGMKSVAYRLTFSSLEKTFGEGEVDSFIKKILFNLKAHGIELRQ